MFYGSNRLSRALFMVLTLGMAFLMTSIVHAAPTGMPSGVMVGSYPYGGTDTRLRLTGTAKTSKEIFLGNVFDATFVGRPLTVTSASAVYYSQALSFTTIAFPAAATTVSCTTQILIPDNYGSGGVLEVKVYMSTADTAARLRCDVQSQVCDGTTTTALSMGTAVAIPAAATAQFSTVQLTNAATYTAGGTASFIITKNAGSTAVVQIEAVRFVYKPDYVMP